MPQPRSMTLPPGIAAASRAARWSATRERVACSSASGVKNIRCGRVAELDDGPLPQLRLRGGRGCLLGVGLDATYGARDAHRVAAVLGPRLHRLLQQARTLGRAQPVQRLDLHAGILSGDRRPRTRLALGRGEC